MATLRVSCLYYISIIFVLWLGLKFKMLKHVKYCSIEILQLLLLFHTILVFKCITVEFCLRTAEYPSRIFFFKDFGWNQLQSLVILAIS